MKTITEDKREFEKVKKSCELICGFCLLQGDECEGYDALPMICGYGCQVKEVYTASKERYDYFLDVYRAEHPKTKL